MRKIESRIVTYAIRLTVNNEELWLSNDYLTIYLNSDYTSRKRFYSKEEAIERLKVLKKTRMRIISAGTDGLTKDIFDSAKIVKITYIRTVHIR
jgi:hypothetical protein